MKNNTIIFLFLFINSIILLTLQKPAYAQEKHAGSSANEAYNHGITTVRDIRAQVLEKYLDQYKSPLKPFAKDFVEQADANNIDWKLLVAISGVESTFGNAEPADCNNSWGYNIYGSYTRCFKDYKEAITTISKDIRTIYMDKWGAKDVYGIGSLYAASPTWSGKVTYFMNDIDTFSSQFTTQTLPISF